MALIMMEWGVIFERFTRLYNIISKARCFFVLFTQQNPMKAACQILIFLLTGSYLFGQQFYIRGEVKDESGNPLQNVNILLHATGYVYHTGPYGSFGILTNRNTDTLSFWLDGYQKEKRIVSPDSYVTVRLKLNSSSSSNIHRNKLASFTKGLNKDVQKQWFTGDETYASLIENHFVAANKYPSTSLTLSIDRASYSNIRRFINTNTLVPPDAVRIEEMLNYFNENYSEPEGGSPFKTKSVLTDCPWNRDNELLFININSKKLNLDTLPPSNLVFLIDISGSMDMPNRLPLLQSAFRLLVNNLRLKDTVTIVVYGGFTGIKLNATSGAEKEKILKAIDELVPGGSTPGESGIKLAYNVAQSHFIKRGNNRVILATDGDFNVGLKTEDELDELISQRRQSGIYLTCLGVGMGNYKDSKIQTLARKGNGNFAYLDNYREAEKVLFTEFTQTLYAVANDVYLNVEFNPDYVREYRLIGFDNKVGALNDTASVIEGGEIGSGHSMRVVFEINPTDFNKDAVERDFSPGNIAEIKLQYRLPNDTTQKSFSNSIPLTFSDFNSIDRSLRFSTAVIMFGTLLRSSPIAKTISWNDIILLATETSDDQDLLQKEFISLVKQAKILYSKQKKKKKEFLTVR
ncbi:MAG TPA: von Willebrand factor type A domain-containing protein [Chitinophagaceae bacterium]|jgi:Ca-activated chloride channel family protein|nr:von Willebrand factor type A domain-containing protein [Chitinophagaceae bacterium]